MKEKKKSGLKFFVGCSQGLPDEPHFVIKLKKKNGLKFFVGCSEGLPYEPHFVMKEKNRVKVLRRIQ